MSKKILITGGAGFIAHHLVEKILKLVEKRLLNVPAADNTVRLVPPLIVSYNDIDKSISIIKSVLKELK